MHTIRGKKLFEIGHESNFAKVFQSIDGELRVSFYEGRTGGKKIAGADYYTCDLADAEDTARAELERMAARNAVERAEVVAELQEWCRANYNRGGDRMVECWDKKAFEDLLKEVADSKAKALGMLKVLASIYRERQADADSYRETYY